MGLQSEGPKIGTAFRNLVLALVGPAYRWAAREEDPIDAANREDPIGETKSYSVLVRAVVNIRCQPVVATSQRGAIDMVLETIHNDLYELLRRNKPTRSIRYVEYGEDFDGYLVDEIGDVDFNRSIWWKDGKKGLEVDLI